MHQNKNLISLLNINKLLHKPKPVLVPGTFHLLNCFVNMPKYGFFSIFKTFVQQNLRIQSSLVLNWHRIKIIQRFCKKSQLHQYSGLTNAFTLFTVVLLQEISQLLICLQVIIHRVKLLFTVSNKIAGEFTVISSFYHQVSNFYLRFH